MNPRRMHVAFTLIEMLLALTLTAVLLTIVSVTIGAVARDSERLESMRAEPLWLDSVVEVLRRDLHQSDTYQVKDGVLILHSHAENKGDHDPVLIEYEILNLNGADWLVRSTFSAPVTPASKPAVELLCGGVKAWNLAMYGEEGEGVTLGQVREGSQTTPPLDPATLPPVPDQVRVSFTLASHKTIQLSTRRNASSLPPDNGSNTNRLTKEHLIVVR